MQSHTYSLTNKTMSKSVTKFIKEINIEMARYYHCAHSAATKRGIQEAKARKKLLTGTNLPCKAL